MLTRKTAPAANAVSDAEILAHLKIDATALAEADISSKVLAATAEIESGTGRQLIEATWQLILPTFPDSSILCLPKPPLKETGVTITYLDDVGATQTLSATKYTVFAPKGEQCLAGWISLNALEVWPTTYPYSEKAVTIEFKAGYGTAAADVPGFLRSMVLIRLGEFYEMRQEGTIGVAYSKVIDLQRALAGWRVMA